MNKKGFTVIDILMALGLIVIIIGGGVYCFYVVKGKGTTTQPKASDAIEQQIKLDQPENKWETYRNDIVGIEFDYPKVWGKPYTDPYIKHTTDFSNLDRKSKPTPLSIVFEGDNTPAVYIFDGSGTDYIKNISSCEYKTGGECLYDIMDVVKTNNICDNSFIPYRRDEYTSELARKCDNDILTTLYLDTDLYKEYRLRHLAFKNLENDYFDSALISNSNKLFGSEADYVAIKETSTLDIDGFLDKTEKRDTYEKDKNDFEQFVHSIKAFVPIESTYNFRKITREEEKADKNAQTIYKYYELLSDDEAEKAYEMNNDARKMETDAFRYAYYSALYGGGDSHANYIKERGFDQQAKNKEDRMSKIKYFFESINSATPFQLEKEIDKSSSNHYRFRLDFRTGFGGSDSYRVTAISSEGKIDVLLTEIITEEVSFSEKLRAFSKKILNTNYVVLVKDEKETTIEDSYNPHGPKGLSFSNLKFSPNGEYLQYLYVGWEWDGVRLYNVNNGKKIALSATGSRGFTPDGKYFYSIGASPMTGNSHSVVYDLSTFEISYNFFKDVIENYGFEGNPADYEF